MLVYDRLFNVDIMVFVTIVFDNITTYIFANGDSKFQKTEGGGWQWILPKSHRNAIMALALFRDQSYNILYGTKLKKRAFTEWVKLWTNLNSFIDKGEVTLFDFTANMIFTTWLYCENYRKVTTSIFRRKEEIIITRII